MDEDEDDAPGAGEESEPASETMAEPSFGGMVVPSTPPTPQAPPATPAAPTSGSTSTSVKISRTSRPVVAEKPTDGTPYGIAAAAMRGVEDDNARLKAANLDVAAKSQQYEGQLADVYRRQNELQQSWAGVDERANVAAAAEANKYIAAYQQQMAAVRQMAVDPTGPIGSMSAGQMAGLTLANFAQGFLAARYGIEVDVTGQIDKWVDRSIQEQQRRIQQAQAGAEDQLHLYEIARQTSRDDAEARQRYRGLVIAGMQSQIQAHASQFRSDSAMADAQAKNAALDVELQKSKFNIWKDTHTMVHADVLANETIRHNKAMEGLHREELEIKKKAAENKGQELIPIDDVETPGQMKWAVPKIFAKQATDAAKNYGVIYGAGARLQKAYDALDKEDRDSWVSHATDFLHGKRTASTKMQEFINSARDYTYQRVTHGEAKRFNQAEFDQMLEQVAPPDIFTRRDSENFIINQREGDRQNFESTMNVYSHPQFRGRTAAPGLKAEHAAKTNPQEPVTSLISGETGVAESGTNDRHVGQHSEAFANWARDHYKRGDLAVAPTDHDEAIEHVARAMVDPQQVLKDHEGHFWGIKAAPGDTPEKIQKEAKEALYHIAHNESVSEPRRAFAEHLYLLGMRDPKEMLRQINTVVADDRIRGEEFNRLVKPYSRYDAQGNPTEDADK